MNNKQLLAFADALDDRALKLCASAEAEEFNDEDEQAEYVWATAAAGATALLISAAIRDVVNAPKLPSGIH